MNKLLATLIAGFFAIGAFAQTPAAATPVAPAGTKVEAKTEAKADMKAAKEEKKAAHKAHKAEKKAEKMSAPAADAPAVKK
jgi:hypothetical protein